MYGVPKKRKRDKEEADDLMRKLAAISEESPYFVFLLGLVV